MSKQKITIRAHVSANIDAVWRAWNTPEDIRHWNSASDDWYCPQAENDLRPEGTFKYRMAARDGSAAFDFEGIYDRVQPMSEIAYTLGDGRQVINTFTAVPTGVEVVTVFEAEGENTLAMQQEGWQSILNHFKQYVEGN